jgi:hypothetical protein
MTPTQFRDNEEGYPAWIAASPEGLAVRRHQHALVVAVGPTQISWR